MRRLAAILSWILLLAGVAAAIGIATGNFPKSASAPPPEAGQSAAEPGRLPFAGFPIDMPRTIDFDLDANTMNQLSDREKIDQKRDWLLYTVVVDSGISADAVNRGLYDLAPVRHGYMRHVARFEYGLTRSCVLGEGEVIALIPQNEPKKRADDLAHIFDEARKNLGTVPAQLIVFEYVLDGEDRATVTRRASVSGKDMLQAAAGYYEATISSAADLEKFMGSIDDLVYARIEDNGLRIGGRKLAGSEYRNIRVEDVAAIWQAEEHIHKALDDFREKWEARARQFNSTYGVSHPYGSQAEYSMAFQEQVQKPHDDEEERLKLVNGSGFSLDPAYDYDGLASVLEKPLLDVYQASKIELRSTLLYGAAVAKAASLPELLAVAKVPEAMLTEAVSALRGHPRAAASPSSRRTFPSITRGLGKGAPSSGLLSGLNPDDFLSATPATQASTRPDELPFLRLSEQCKQLARQGDPAAELAARIFETLNIKYRFQAARYDGPLNGTEVGMVLYLHRSARQDVGSGLRSLHTLLSDSGL